MRLFGLRDVAFLRQMQPQGVAFDLRRTLLGTPSPVAAALLGYLSHQQLGPVTCVMRAKERQTAWGFIQAWPRPDRGEWDLSFIAPSLDEAMGVECWSSLLTHLVVLTAQWGAQRIYARVNGDGQGEDVLRQAGFTVIAREEVLTLTQPPAPSATPAGLRLAEASDRPAIEALYREIIPPLVQQAEGNAPHWCAARARLVNSPVAAEEYVWAERECIVGYLILCKGERGTWMEVVAHPDHPAPARLALAYLLGQWVSTATSPLLCAAPDYAVGLRGLLRDSGLAPLGRQVFMVAHTVARVAVRRRRAMVAGLEQGVDVSSVGHMCEGRPEAEVAAPPRRR
jgi:hypothetical protein